MFLYYLINIWKTNQNWLKKTTLHLAGLAHLCVYIRKIFISPRWDLDKIKWDLTYAGWLTSHMNTFIFLYQFLKEGDISPRPASPPNRASLPPYEQPLKLIAEHTTVLTFIQLVESNWYNISGRKNSLVAKFIGVWQPQIRTGDQGLDKSNSLNIKSDSTW